MNRITDGRKTRQRERERDRKERTKEIRREIRKTKGRRNDKKTAWTGRSVDSLAGRFLFQTPGNTQKGTQESGGWGQFMLGDDITGRCWTGDARFLLL